MSVLQRKSSSANDGTSPPTGSSVTGPRCLARFDYDTPEPDDLHFTAGDVIELIEHVSDEWLKGRLRGCVGMFPLSFVEILEDVCVSDTPPALPSSPPPSQHVKPTWDDKPTTTGKLALNGKYFFIEIVNF